MSMAAETAPGRYAVYYAPDPEDPLWHAGCSWLGRDPAKGQPLLQPLPPGLSPASMASLTEAPRLYGFHATLKQPVRLAPPHGRDAFMEAVERLARHWPAFPMPMLRVALHQGFLALLEDTPSKALQSLCDACVMELDQFRAPLSQEERQRRRRTPLSPEQDNMLERWGYPEVFGHWRFHMTLSGKLAADNDWQHSLLEAAQQYFAGPLQQARQADALCVYWQPAPGSAFSLLARFPLRKAASAGQ